jgi:hypothetical protein
MIAFGNIVLTGLEISGKTIYMAEAGPVPHEPEDGKVVSFRPKSSTAKQVASGARLLVDVEFGRRAERGRRRDLFALSQGVFGGGPGGSGIAKHRQPREGEGERELQGRRRRLGPADLA